MNFPEWMLPALRRLNWLLRPTYIAGVFPVCIDDGGRVLLIRKRLGIATGWQLPGGAKEYGVSLEQSACDELQEETGLTSFPGCLVLARVQCIEAHRDLNFAFLVRVWEGTLGPQDTAEIAEARWVPLREANDMLYPPHRPMLEAVQIEHFCTRT